MRSLLIIVISACGTVKDTPDASIEPPQPDALACASTQLACGGACIDPQSDERYCGNCTTACGQTETCTAGGCLDPTASCAIIKMLNASAPDGLYTHMADGKMFYCDMASGTTYDELAFGQFNGTPPAGYTIIRASELQTPAGQKAFIALYNLNSGARLVAPWASANCCMTAAPNARLMFAGSQTFPFEAGAGQCNPPGGYTAAVYRITVANNPPIASTFFLTNPVTESTVCSDGDNPGLFFKKRM